MMVTYDDADADTLMLLTDDHKRTAYTAFWTKAPPGRKKNIPKGTASNGYEAKFQHSY